MRVHASGGYVAPAEKRDMVPVCSTPSTLLEGLLETLVDFGTELGCLVSRCLKTTILRDLR